MVVVELEEFDTVKEFRKEEFEEMRLREAEHWKVETGPCERCETVDELDTVEGGCEKLCRECLKHEQERIA